MARFLLAALACALSWFVAANGDEGSAITLRNTAGMEVSIIPTGACVRRLLLPAADGGPPVDVMMGFEEQDVDKYRVRHATGWLAFRHTGLIGMQKADGLLLVSACSSGVPLRLRRSCPQQLTQAHPPLPTNAAERHQCVRLHSGARGRPHQRHQLHTGWWVSPGGRVVSRHMWGRAPKCYLPRAASQMPHVSFPLAGMQHTPLFPMPIHAAPQA